MKGSLSSARWRSGIGCLLASTVVAPLAAQPGAEGNAAELPDQVVTADPALRAPDELAQPVTVVDGVALQRARSGSIGEVLDGQPGTASSDFGPGVGRPVVRGLQGSRVLLLQDGVRTMDVSGEGADHANALDPANAEQVEIFRGPATLLFGSGAAGGVVNVRTRRFDERIAPGLSGSGDYQFGENGSDRLARAEAEYGLSPNLAVRADFGLRRSGNFEIPGFAEVDPEPDARRGVLDNSSVSLDSRALTALWRGEAGFLGIGYSFFRTDYGVPEGIDPDDVEFERIKASSDRVDLRGALDAPLPGISQLRLKAAYTNFEQQEVEFEGSGAAQETIVEADFDNEEWELRLDAQHAPIAGFHGVVGFQYNDRDFGALLEPEEGGEDFYVPPTDTRSWALFAVEDRPTAFGSLQLGARVERVDSDSRDLPARDFTPFSLSAGSIVDLDDAHHLRLGFTHARRAPSAEQLYADGPHAAAGTFEIGDPDLDVEQYNNFEIGIDRHLGRFQYAATLFYNRVDDFVFLAFQDDGSGEAVRVDDEGRTAAEGAVDPENILAINEQRDAAFWGIEAEAHYDLLQGPVDLRLQASGDAVRGRLRDPAAGERRDLPRITPVRIGAGFESRWRGLRLASFLRRVQEQSRVSVAESQSKGYFLWSADLEWETALLGSELTWFLRGRNLLDREARRHTSFLKEEAPLPGRSVYVGLRAAFGR